MHSGKQETSLRSSLTVNPKFGESLGQEGQRYQEGLGPTQSCSSGRLNRVLKQGYYAAPQVCKVGYIPRAET